jgi:hypothetical protein
VTRFSLAIRVLFLLGVGVLPAAGGCAAAKGSKDGDGLKLADPSPAFMKKVDRDPFPRAGMTNGSAG